MEPLFFNSSTSLGRHGDQRCLDEAPSGGFDPCGQVKVVPLPQISVDSPCSCLLNLILDYGSPWLGGGGDLLPHFTQKAQTKAALIRLVFLIRCEGPQDCVPPVAEHRKLPSHHRPCKHPVLRARPSSARRERAAA